MLCCAARFDPPFDDDEMVFKPASLPLLVLPHGSVLLPGSVMRIGVSRKDTASLLSRIYRQGREGSLDVTTAALGCVAWKEEKPSTEVINDCSSNLFEVGILAKVVRLERRLVEGFVVVVEGVSRFRIDRVTQTSPYMEAIVFHFPQEQVRRTHIQAYDLFVQMKSASKDLVKLLKSLQLPGLVLRHLENFVAKADVEDAGALCDFMVSTIEARYEEKLEVLAAHEINLRLERSLELVRRQLDVLRISQKINTSVDTKLSKKQREFYLRQQMNAIREELGEKDQGNEDDEMNELIKKLEAAKLSPESDKVVQRELKRLKRMQPTQAEYQVCRTYLETLSEIPWSVSTPENYDKDMLVRAREQFDKDHYGLEKIKKRLMEYLAVLRLKRELSMDVSHEVEETTQSQKGDEIRIVNKGPILLLVGPPGVGKTSLAKSVAHTLGRKLHRISLGGIRDEAEIRGHRRTYVGAMPGVIVQGLKSVGVANPVFLLDEIDKIAGANFHGDPSAAMLEVLDPEQNYAFNDHYVNVPVDLSKVLFIATANTTDTIPAPLLDRMETITLSGYTYQEKLQIAKQFLLPKQIKANGLDHAGSEERVRMDEDVLTKVAVGYTREAGVRNFERELASVCRAKAVEFSASRDAGDDFYSPHVSAEDIERILGIEKYETEIAERVPRVGVVTGLAYMGSGHGGLMFVEATAMPGTGKLQLTGKLGDVIKESAQLALSWVKTHSYRLHLTQSVDENVVKDRDVHIHLPAGATPKDGPSAGVAITLALISLFRQRTVAPNVAMTGEISLRGNVMAVGGIKEKVIGAHRAGVRRIIIPHRNRKDVMQDLPVEVRNDIQFVYVTTMWEVLEQVWGEHPVMESRL